MIMSVRSVGLSLPSVSVVQQHQQQASIFLDILLRKGKPSDQRNGRDWFQQHEIFPLLTTTYDPLADRASKPNSLGKLEYSMGTELEGSATRNWVMEAGEMIKHRVIACEQHSVDHQDKRWEMPVMKIDGHETMVRMEQFSHCCIKEHDGLQEMDCGTDKCMHEHISGPLFVDKNKSLLQNENIEGPEDIAVQPVQVCLSYTTVHESAFGNIEENNKPTPLIHEDLYENIITMVLQTARSLPKNQLLSECLHFFEGRIDTICGNVILHRLHSELLYHRALEFFEWMRLHSPCLLDSRSLCTIFTILGDANMADQAFILFSNMRECQIAQFVQPYNALLSALLKQNRFEKLLEAFQVMAQKRIQPDSVTFSILMVALRKSGSSIKELWMLFMDMEREVFSGHTVFGVLIKALCDNGHLEEALITLSEMEKRGLEANTMIYNMLINAYGKVGMVQEAEGLICEMKEKRVILSVATFNSLIDAYGRQGRPEVGDNLLEKMKNVGLRPDVRSYGPLISAYARLRLSEKAASTFLHMRRNGVQPNVVCYAALIHAYAETGWHEKAQHAFDNMLREGLTPNVKVYTSLMHGYRQAGDVESVQAIWKKMRQEKCEGTRVTFNILMDAYAKQGYYGEARDAMFVFGNLGYKPDRKTFNMLLNAYGRGLQLAKIPEVLSEMKAAGFTPNACTYTTLIFTYLRVRDFKSAFYYHDKMCKDNQLPDKLTYLKLRAILDSKFEAKLVKNMASIIGLQRDLYEPPSTRKKVKVFHKRRPSIPSEGKHSLRIQRHK